MHRGRYPYTQQLLTLEHIRHRKLTVPWNKVVTPIQPEFWIHELGSHHDRIVRWVLRGLQNGFRISFHDNSVQLAPARSNMSSAAQHLEVVEKYIQEEVSSGHLLPIGLVEHVAQLRVHVSPLGVIPKKGKTDQWRMIIDLSSPHGHSINDGISKKVCSLHYSSLDDAAAQVARLGQGAWLAKMDIKQAYCNIPVAPEDRKLLGLQWKGKVYIDQVLPFGIRSAPLIFSAVADAMLWIMLKHGVLWAIHYIDDFLTIGKPGTDECLWNATIIQRLCKEAGLPMESSKSVGPATSLVFLGIKIDSVRGELRLPQEKLQLKDSLTHWRGLKVCKKRDLLSLI